MKPSIAAVLLVSALVAACDLFTDYALRIDGVRAFSPPAVYADWHAATEACSGLAGDFAAIEWFLASWITIDGSIAYGAWRPPHEILIVSGYQDDDYTVQHEMLHDLLGGDRDHTSPQWSACELIQG